MNNRENFASGDAQASAAAPGIGTPSATTGATTGAPYGDIPYPPPGPAVGYGYGPVPPAPGTAPANPATALVLGFIPGVGAMYNGQFAKGLAHIVIFAVLISLSDHVNGIFGLLVAGWIFYMVFDAYQTARARRDGLQAPDPFGLNNIGERFGLTQGPSWSDFTARPAPGMAPGSAPAPSAQAYASSAPPPYSAVPPYGAAPGTAGYQSSDVRYETGPAGAYAANPDVPYAASAYAGQTYGAATASAGSAAAYGTAAASGANPFSTPYAGNYAPPYIPGPIPPPAADPHAGNRSGMPSGALWLIGLGVLALVSTLGHEFFWPSRFLGGAVLIVLGIALVIRRLQEAQRTYPTDTAAATWLSIRGSKGGVFLAVIGIFLLISAAHWHVWNYGWPYLLILLGVYQIGERAAYNRMAASGTVMPAAASAGFSNLPKDPLPAEPSTAQPAHTGNADPISIFPRDKEGLNKEGR